jgi:hypothetical protein
MASGLPGMPAAQAQTPGPLSKDDVSALLTAKAVDIGFPDGTAVSLTNATGGSLSAFMWHASTTSGDSVRSASGTGSWNISSEGRYCLKAGWRAGKRTEMLNACRSVMPSGTDSYILKADDGQPDWTMRLKN